MITNHTQLLNALIEKYGLKSYLEIGVQTRQQNFDKIRCKNKMGIDPEIQTDCSDDFVMLKGITSDYYFNSVAGKYAVYDLIFIDGLHHADQVKRDFENSLRCLSDNGFIVIHDVLPENEAGTIVPRETKQWWGDVYKWALHINDYDGINYKTFNIDNGCMVVCKNSDNSNHYPYIKNNDYSDWEWYKLNGRTLMNVTDEVKI